MVSLFDSTNYHVVNVEFQVSPYLVGKEGVHEALVGSTSILEDEGHGIVIVVTTIRHEGYFRCI